MGLKAITQRMNKEEIAGQIARSGQPNSLLLVWTPLAEDRIEGLQVKRGPSRHFHYSGCRTVALQFAPDVGGGLS